MSRFAISLLYGTALAVSTLCSTAVASTTDEAALHKLIFDSIIPDPNPIVVYGEPSGSKLEFLRTGDSTCGKYLYVVATVPPGSGPPPHFITGLMNGFMRRMAGR